MKINERIINNDGTAEIISRDMTEEEIKKFNEGIRQDLTDEITLEDLQEAILELAEMIGGAE